MKQAAKSFEIQCCLRGLNETAGSWTTEATLGDRSDFGVSPLEGASVQASSQDWQVALPSGTAGKLLLMVARELCDITDVLGY